MSLRPIEEQISTEQRFHDEPFDSNAVRLSALAERSLRKRYPIGHPIALIVSLRFLQFGKPQQVMREY